MHLAERWQAPVTLLTDQFLADSYRAVTPFDLTGLKPVRAGDPDASGGWDYKRYLITDSGVSPRALPGLGRELVVVDSDEHTEDGHLTEDLSVRVAMQDKRQRKLDGMAREVLPPLWEGPEEAGTVLVGWGSTQGSVSETAAWLRSKGQSVAACHFRQLWPLDPAQFLPRLARAGQVVMVEGNSTGQMARLIRRETGFHISRLVTRYDGLPITPQYILRALGA
jgi:2-oxoglutarate ferredoxin oxidoreductase subunit alpha